MTDHIGIEVECESLSVGRRQAELTLDGGTWLVESDGSLRGNMSFELKSNGPQPVNLLRSHLAELYPVLMRSSGTWRAAVHVHVDLRNEQWYRRALALAAAYAFDLCLFERFSPERVESNFCVPLSHKSMDVLDCINTMLVRHETTRYGKYSSVNVSRIHDLGTLEFRHMRTPEAGDTVSSVQEALRSIEEYARACHLITSSIMTARLRLSDRRGTGRAMAEAFLEMLAYIEMNNRRGSVLVPNHEHVGDVLHTLSGAPSFDITTLDLGSVVRVQSGRPSRGTPRYDVVVESATLRSILEQAEADRVATDFMFVESEEPEF
jgi:hypothetical protein